MTTVSVGTKTSVLLNTGRVVNEIIAKRAGLTHERPVLPCCRGTREPEPAFLLAEDQGLEEARRLLHHLMNGAGREGHAQIAEEESLGLLKAYLEEPESWYAHHYRYAASIMHRIVTNQPLRKSTPELEDLQRVTSTFLTSINSSFAEFFPQLNHLPRFLQFWRAHWESMGVLHYRVFSHWWDGMKSLRDPAAEPSFVRDEVLRQFPNSEDQAMYLTSFLSHRWVRQPSHDHECVGHGLPRAP